MSDDQGNNNKHVKGRGDTKDGDSFEKVLEQLKGAPEEQEDTSADDSSVDEVLPDLNAYNGVEEDSAVTTILPDEESAELYPDVQLQLPDVGDTLGEGFTYAQSDEVEIVDLNNMEHTTNGKVLLSSLKEEAQPGTGTEIQSARKKTYHKPSSSLFQKLSKATQNAPDKNMLSAAARRAQVAQEYRKSTWKTLVILGMIAFVVLSLFAWDRVWRRSDHPHFVYLADAYLNGKLHIAKPPAWMDDYVWNEGKWWVTFPPAPAVAMMPGVALCTKAGFDTIPGIKTVLCGVPKNPVKGHPYFNDTLFTILLSVLNAILIWLILERLSLKGISGRTRKENIWLWLLFVFGTMQFSCSVLGQVWYTALIMGSTMLLLFIYFAWDAKHPFLAGLALVLGFASRTPVFFAFPLFLYFLFYSGDERVERSWKEIFAKCIWFGAPILMVGILLMLHNYFRFHNPMEFGHDFIMKDRHLRHGMFGYAWLSRNLSAALTVFPRFMSEFPYVKFSFHGTSMLWLTPAWLYLFWPKRVGKLYWALALTTIFVALPTLFYKSTGFGQFGYRYNVDYAALMIVMLAIGGRRIGKLFIMLIFLSIFWNGLGAIVFRRFGDVFMHWDLFPETPFSRD